jgi:hypothetical protein
MPKTEKIFTVKNIRTGETFVTSSAYEREIDGVRFIGVWREHDLSKRLNWIRKDSVAKIPKNK